MCLGEAVTAGRWVADHYEGKSWHWEPETFVPLTAQPKVWKAPVFEGWNGFNPERGLIRYGCKTPHDAACWALGIERIDVSQRSDKAPSTASRHR
jgi:hypothetical protein